MLNSYSELAKFPCQKFIFQKNYGSNGIKVKKKFYFAKKSIIKLKFYVIDAFVKGCFV